MRLSRGFVSLSVGGLGLLALCSLTGCGGAVAATEGVGAAIFDPIFGSGHSPAPTPDPSPPTRPNADYVGTWSGRFSPPPSPPPVPGAPPSSTTDLRSGTLTLAFSATGVVTGQISDATTGQTGTVGGTLKINGNTTTGYVDLTFTLDGQSQETTYFTTIDGNDVLQGSFLLPAAPGFPDTAPAVYTLSKS